MDHAFGKVILFGEHTVVYGAPALAVGLNQGATARAEPAESSELRINGELRNEPELGRALGAIIDAFRGPPLKVDVELQVRGGFGLGASAAIGVATTRAVARALGAACEPDALFEIAMRWERVFHGNPSGVDVAVAIRGGCVRYQKDVGLRPVPLDGDLTLAVGLVGPPSSTKTMVEAVARLKQRRPEQFDKTLKGMAALVENAELCLRGGDLGAVGQLMDYAQMLLAGLFVSTEALETACRSARANGALGAKLTGAGGGGSVIALCPDPEPILSGWKQEGIEGFSCTVARASSET